MSKPFEIHPALLVLIVVFLVSLMLSLWGGGLIPVFTTIIGFVIVWTAAFFLILYALVWLARTIYARRHPPAPPRTVSVVVLARDRCIVPLTLRVGTSPPPGLTYFRIKELGHYILVPIPVRSRLCQA